MPTPTQSYTWNAYESTLATDLAAGSGVTSVAVASTDNLTPPMYLVIDPDDSTKREWVKVLAFSAGSIDNMVRGLAGSTGVAGEGIAHSANAIVRAVYTKQVQDDLFFDIATNETDIATNVSAIAGNASDLVTHKADVADPHAAADYQKASEADALYLKLTGGSVTGNIHLSDTLYVGKIQLQSDSATASQPNIHESSSGWLMKSSWEAWSKAEADARFLQLTGGVMTGNLSLTTGVELRFLSGAKAVYYHTNGSRVEAQIDSAADRMEFRSVGTSAVREFMFYLPGGTAEALKISSGEFSVRTISGQAFRLRDDTLQRTYLNFVGADTTASAANMYVNPDDGRIRMAASTLDIKSNRVTIPFDEAAGVIKALDPISFTSDVDDDTALVGFGAEPTAAVDARLGTDGPNYDVRGIVAHLVAVTQQLLRERTPA